MTLVIDRINAGAKNGSMDHAMKSSIKYMTRPFYVSAGNADRVNYISPCSVIVLLEKDKNTRAIFYLLSEWVVGNLSSFSPAVAIWLVVRITIVYLYRLLS